MSKPRYDWWGYVKGMIRRYPELCARERELHAVSLAQPVDGLPHGGGRADPTARAALRELPAIHKRELEAVRRAVAATAALPTGDERLRLVRLVFWDRTHTLQGAALTLHISIATAWRWHGDFIREVAHAFGFLEG